MSTAAFVESEPERQRRAHATLRWRSGSEKPREALSRKRGKTNQSRQPI